MTTAFNRRAVLKSGAGLIAATALAPAMTSAQTAASINYWHTFTSQTEIAGLDEVMKLFAAAHPDISVTAESIPNPEFMAKITAAVVSGSRPNVSMVSSERFADLFAMGALTDLTDRIATWDRRSDFDDKRFASISKDGKVYGVPAFAFVDWMYYRKDWFETAGIAPPTTFEELRQAAIALTDVPNGRYGMGLRGGPGGQSYVINVMEAFGAPLQQADGTIGLDRDNAIAAMDFYAGLMTKDGVVPPSAPNDGFRQIIEGFQTGQTAMIWHHTGSYQDIASMLNRAYNSAPWLCRLVQSAALLALGTRITASSMPIRMPTHPGTLSNPGASPTPLSPSSIRPAFSRPPMSLPKIRASPATRYINLPPTRLPSAFRSRAFPAIPAGRKVLFFRLSSAC